MRLRKSPLKEEGLLALPGFTGPRVDKSAGKSKQKRGYLTFLLGLRLGGAEGAGS
jgi:hypothetical protein